MVDKPNLVLKQTRAERRSEFKRGFAKDLRANATEPERMLWAALRGKQFAQLRFRRQQPIGPYIVDIFCPAAKLVIELDGGQHGEDRNVSYDDARTKWLEDRNYRVLRFSNIDFLKDKDTVIEGIWRAIMDSGKPLPEIRCANFDPPSRGG